jgi:methylase of polypeptide subunit release factors
LLNNGFEKIIATDTNPNSIIGIHEQIKNGKINSRIDLFHGDLFADQDSKSDLIVFNPPWIPASYKLSAIDMAIYYDSELFSRFFEQAKERLTENGKIVLLFSNLAQVTNLTKTNPIEEELKTSDFFKKEILLHRNVGASSKKTKRDQNWRSDELVELWVIKRKNINS